MDADERMRLIATYRSGYDDVVSALAEAGSDHLDDRFGPDEWSPRMVVHHLADSEMRSAIRLRQLLAEDDPTIQAYDEATYAVRLHYDRPIEGSLEAFRVARSTTVELLDRMGDTDWSRAGVHQESGPYSAEDWLRIYASHGSDHADQIRRAVRA